jgi:hypothetical protein
MESIFKKAILRLSIRQFEPCIFVIFKPKILKFWILIENNKRINGCPGFFDLLSTLSRCFKDELRTLSNQGFLIISINSENISFLLLEYVGSTW